MSFSLEKLCAVFLRRVIRPERGSIRFGSSGEKKIDIPAVNELFQILDRVSLSVGIRLSVSILGLLQ
jgi:hypothetical protein